MPLEDILGHALRMRFPPETPEEGHDTVGT